MREAIGWLFVSALALGPGVIAIGRLVLDLAMHILGIPHPH